MSNDKQKPNPDDLVPRTGSVARHYLPEILSGSAIDRASMQGRADFAQASGSPQLGWKSASSLPEQQPLPQSSKQVDNSKPHPQPKPPSSVRAPVDRKAHLDAKAQDNAATRQPTLTDADREAIRAAQQRDSKEQDQERDRGGRDDR